MKLDEARGAAAIEGTEQVALPKRAPSVHRKADDHRDGVEHALEIRIGAEAQVPYVVARIDLVGRVPGR